MEVCLHIKNYTIKQISKKECECLLFNHHYLSKNTKTFRSGINYGLFFEGLLIGVAIYHSPSAPETVKGCFGLARNDQQGIYELGRLSIDPSCYEKNLTSWFLSRTMKLLKAEFDVRAILTYADSEHHTGFIYQATNFKYYGLTASKKDYWFLQDDGTYIKHQRGKIKGCEGEWRPRSRKHRYLIMFDKTLECLWQQESYPKINNTAEFNKEAGG